jgi:asparagine synthase (glutamine-hydrolysing)
MRQGRAMSTIAGIWSFNGEVPVSLTCRTMLQALNIYGPDDTAEYSSSSIALGRCLLRLLPEDEFDTQPLSATGVTALVADIRLDNRPELGVLLGLSNQQTAMMADSAMLLAAWQRWQERCVEHLSGAFSFAVWNQQEQHLFLARDRVGERPLFYASTAGCFAFASMPKALHPLSFVGSEVDEDYVARYLMVTNIAIERSIFRRMLRLPPGHALSVRRDQKKLWRYWQTDNLPELRLGSPEEYLDCFRERFDRAVRVRLRTRGGIGATLSGGLDSAAVAATAARLLAAEGRELTCFTAVPRPDFQCTASSTHFYDEGPAAAEVAALYPNIRHILVESSATSFLDILDLNNDLYGHPCFGPTNEVWANAIMTQARQKGITLLLDGSCGNSTFSYEGLPALSTWLRNGEWGTLVRVVRQIRRARSASLRLMLRHAVWPSLPFWLRRMTDPHLRSFTLDYTPLRREIVERLGLQRDAMNDMSVNSLDPRKALHALLTYADMSDTSISSQGGWQLDSRDPTFDPGVVEFCLTVPLEEFVRGGELRSLARRAMVGRLPSSTLQRRRRGRQAADWYLNLTAVRGRMSAEVERLRSSPLASRMLDLERMSSLLENWPDPGSEKDEVIAPYHTTLTLGLSVGKFLMQYDPIK